MFQVVAGQVMEHQRLQVTQATSGPLCVCVCVCVCVFVFMYIYSPRTTFPLVAGGKKERREERGERREERG